MSLISPEPILYAIQTSESEKMCCEQVSQIIEVKPDSAVFVDGRGFGALHYACKRGWPQLVAHLLELHRLDVELAGNEGQQPVHWAAAYATVHVVALLVRHGASLMAADSGGCHALHYAAMHGRHITVQYLLMKGCVPNCVDGGGHTPLHRAACRLHLLTIKTLLSHADIDCNVRDSKGQSALLWALRSTGENVLQTLACCVKWRSNVYNSKCQKQDQNTMC